MLANSTELGLIGSQSSYEASACRIQDHHVIVSEAKDHMQTTNLYCDSQWWLRCEISAKLNVSKLARLGTCTVGAGLLT